MRFAAGLVVAIAVLGAGSFGWVYFGGYDVAASTPHADVVMRLLRTALRGNVQAHARHVKVPNLNDANMLREGAEHYAGNCVACHGAPGVQPGELAKGLMPMPPDLSKTARQWSTAELFWIIKNGIKSTGMPAWGKTHDDDELWAITAFVSKLPGMSAAEYARVAPPAVMTGSHEHMHMHMDMEMGGDAHGDDHNAGHVHANGAPHAR